LQKKSTAQQTSHRLAYFEFFSSILSYCFL